MSENKAYLCNQCKGQMEDGIYEAEVYCQVKDGEGGVVIRALCKRCSAAKTAARRFSL